MSKLILMVGISGSGKTTWSQAYIRLYPHVIRLSTDECRAIAGMSEGDQTVSHKVFESIYLITEHLLKQGETVLIDATNYNKKNRKRFLEIAQKTNSDCDAITVGAELTLGQILERNNKRDRKVPREVIERQFNGLDTPTMSEGFRAVFNERILQLC